MISASRLTTQENDHILLGRSVSTALRLCAKWGGKKYSCENKQALGIKVAILSLKRMGLKKDKSQFGAIHSLAKEDRMYYLFSKGDSPPLLQCGASNF